MGLPLIASFVVTSLIPAIKLPSYLQDQDQDPHDHDRLGTLDPLPKVTHCRPLALWTVFDMASSKLQIRRLTWLSVLQREEMTIRFKNIRGWSKGRPRRFSLPAFWRKPAREDEDAKPKLVSTKKKQYDSLSHIDFSLQSFERLNFL